MNTNWKIDLTTIVKFYQIFHLLDIFEFIKVKAEGYKKNPNGYYYVNQISSYANLIETTNLEAWMFTGGKAIFKGFKVKVKTNVLRVSNNSYVVRFSDDGIELISIDKYFIFDNLGFIQTLSDLAELTKDNPLELC